MPPGDASPITRFAAETLGLEHTLSPGETRAALLRRLRDQEAYWPSPNTHEAMMVLLGRPESGALRLAEAAARAEVDAFTAEYFDLPIEARCSRWNALLRTCSPHAHLLHRLKELEAGLAVQRRQVPHDSPLVDRLIKDSLDLSLLRPAARATCRRELAAALRSDPTIEKRDLALAVRSIRRTFPAVAALAPDFLADLESPRRIPLRYRFAQNRFKAWKAIGAKPWHSVFISILCCTAFGAMLKSLTNAPKPSPRWVSAAASRPSLGPANGARPAESVIRLFQDQFKAPIRRELAKFGKQLDEAQLERIVRTLPAEGVTGGLATMLLAGSWNSAIHDRYAAALKRELSQTGLGLSELQLDEIARGSIPRPSGSSATSVPQVPF